MSEKLAEKIEQMKEVTSAMTLDEAKEYFKHHHRMMKVFTVLLNHIAPRVFVNLMFTYEIKLPQAMVIKNSSLREAAMCDICEFNLELSMSTLNHLEDVFIFDGGFQSIVPTVDKDRINAEETLSEYRKNLQFIKDNFGKKDEGEISND